MPVTCSYLSIVNPLADALLVVFPDADLQLLHVVAVRDAHHVGAHESLQPRPHAGLAEPVTDRLNAYSQIDLKINRVGCDRTFMYYIFHEHLTPFVIIIISFCCFAPERKQITISKGIKHI